MKKLSYLGLSCLLIVLTIFVFGHFFSHQDFCIPITFNRAGVPVLKTKIGECTYSMKLDLGSKFQITLCETVLDSLDKEPREIVHWRDAKGNFYESPSFSIPKITIGDTFVLKNLIAVQKGIQYEKNVTIWNDNKNISEPVAFGSLGRPLLEKTNLLLDFPHSVIFLCKDKRSLKKAGFSLEEMIKVPLEITPKGMIIKTETDQGVLKLLIDTCASISLVRASHFQNQEYPKESHGFEVFTSSKFLIEGKDFGKQEFLLYDITPELHELDGVLGMDFLEKRIIYVDYSNRVVFIDK